MKKRRPTPHVLGWVGSPGGHPHLGLGQGCGSCRVGSQPGSPGAVLQDLVDTCQQSVREHCTFSHELLELRQWISVLTQKLEAHRGDTGPWDAQSREVEVEVRGLSPQRDSVPCIPKSRFGEPVLSYWEAETPSPQDLTLCVCVCVLQKLLDEFPGKEAQLPLIEAHGRLVMEKSSPEGAAVVQKELQELVESWGALRLLGESLLR